MNDNKLDYNKNILFITTMYPGPLRKNTPVCHYYVKEWRKFGYNIIVIHYRSIFPKIFSIMAQLFRKSAIKIIGNDNIETDRNKTIVYYIQENIPVYSIPIYKFIPHQSYSKHQINRQLQIISKILSKNNFTPELILGHFYNPQIPIIYKLKKIFPMSKTCVTLHEVNTSVIKHTFGKEYKKYFTGIDIFGFRSKSIQNDFENNYGSKKKYFICYSGIPAGYILPNNRRNFNTFSKFCFVGQLIPLKKISNTIFALAKAFPNKDFEFHIVGVGIEKDNLISQSKKLRLECCIYFHNYLPREEVQSIISNSDCFVMVSKPEVFGLVYLEAMGKGCITIGAKNQGIDGIIINGVNGFLCEADDIDGLANTFTYIKDLSPIQRKSITLKAIETAIELTDEKVAKNYLNSIISVH